MLEDCGPEFETKLFCGLAGQFLRAGALSESQTFWGTMCCFLSLARRCYEAQHSAGLGGGSQWQLFP